MLKAERERAVLVGLQTKMTAVDSFESSFEELHLLTETAGAAVVGTLIQKRDRVDQATYIGMGKIEELKRIIEEKEADLVIFDGELSSVQIRNLENRLDVKIIDRTILILDIFASRAKSREGKLQVQLAQLTYQLPRLTGKGEELSRQGGGIGTRGAGEQKLEIDRRHLRRRIEDIKQGIEDIKRTRQLHREKRKKGH